MRSCRALPTSYSFSTFVRSGEVLVRWESCRWARSPLESHVLYFTVEDLTQLSFSTFYSYMNAYEFPT